MPELRPDQCAFSHEHGYLMVENAVDGALLSRLKQDFAAWVEESRSHDAAWGDTVDGRPRFAQRRKAEPSPGQCAGGGV